MPAGPPREVSSWGFLLFPVHSFGRKKILGASDTHLVITWAAQQQCTLGLISTDGEEKSTIQLESRLWKWLQG